MRIDTVDISPNAEKRTINAIAKAEHKGMEGIKQSIKRTTIPSKRSKEKIKLGGIIMGSRRVTTERSGAQSGR
jgi:hypothetical protein